MEKEEIEKLSMKSRTYFTRVIKGEKNNRNIGVLVLESINEKFDVSEIKLNKKSVRHKSRSQRCIKM